MKSHRLIGFNLLLLFAAIALQFVFDSAKATTIDFKEEKCPIGDGVITTYAVGSIYATGQWLDLEVEGSGSSIINSYPECKGNGFVLFKKDFSRQELDKLEKYVSSIDFTQSRHRSPNYRAYLLKKHLGGYTQLQLGETLLRASWQASDYMEYRYYAKQALEYYSTESEMLRNSETIEAFKAMHIRGDLSRRLLKLKDAYEIFDFQETRPGADGVAYKHFAAYEKSAIRMLWFGRLPITGNSFTNDLPVLIKSWLSGESFF